MEATSHNIGHNTVELNYYRRSLYLSHSAELPRCGKSFYVYCSEAIDLSRAKIGADDERDIRAQADLERKARAAVRRALPVDTANLLNPLLPALNSINQNKN
jgi:hypothetical protein